MKIRQEIIPNYVSSVVGKSIGSTVILFPPEKGETSSLMVGMDGHVTRKNILPGDETATPRIQHEQAVERLAASFNSGMAQRDKNIEQARAQSSMFFKLTLTCIGIAFAVLFLGILLLYIGSVTPGVIITISSLIPKTLAILFFRKDKELRGIIEKFHQDILYSQKILTMIDLSDSIMNKDERDAIKRDIIFKVLEMKKVQVASI